MKLASAVLCVALGCLLGCRTRGPSFDPRESLASVTDTSAFTKVTLSNSVNPAWLRPPTEPYRLGPGDVIDIEMIGDTQPRGATVGPDGKIYYSLLPAVSVWGLTIPETRELLKSEMAKFTRAMPEPVVNLRAVGSKRVWILGSVPSPGVYTLATPTTVLEAISTLGGIPSVGGTPGDAADLSRSFVLRGGHLLPISFERLFNRGDLSQNVYLEPDDFVFIRPANVPSIYVLGAVAVPNVMPYSRNRTVATAIISAGGLQKFAQQTRVAIVRGGLSEPRIAEVDYKAIVTGQAQDVLLEPGDILYVPFSPFRRVAQLVEEVTDQFVRTIAVNEATYIVTGEENPVQISAPFGIITK